MKRYKVMVSRRESLFETIEDAKAFAELYRNSVIYYYANTNIGWVVFSK